MQKSISQMKIPPTMSTDGSDFSFNGPNGLANCNIFNNELTLECKCSPTNKEKSKRNKLREQSKGVPPTSPSVSGSKVSPTSPSVSGSKYEIVRKPSAPSKKKNKVPPQVDILHEPTSKYTLKPLKPAKASSNNSPSVDTDEMARLYDKYLETQHEVVADPIEIIADSTSLPTAKSTKVALFFGSKYKKRAEKKKKECLNENILTKSDEAQTTAAPKRGNLKERSLKFLKAKAWTKPVHTEEVVVENKEGQVPPLEKKESNSSDPTVASNSNDSNSIVDTHPAPDEVTFDNTAMDISVFEVFEQYTGGAFPTHHCSPRLSSAPKQFEINKQAELLARIEELKNELSVSKGTVKELTQELDDVYSGKDFAVHELDRLIDAAKMNENADEEHEKLREIRMYLTDRTEPTISSITTTRSYRAPSDPEDYHPFCLCFRSK